MDITGTKMAQAAKINDSSEPLAFMNQNKKQQKYMNMNMRGVEDERHKVQNSNIELSQRSNSKMHKDRQSCIMKTKEAPNSNEKLQLSGVKMSQYPIDSQMGTQHVSIHPDNMLRNDEYENIYGKTQLEGLNYQNFHRRIKSRSEAYHDSKNLNKTGINMKVAQQNLMFMDFSQ